MAAGLMFTALSTTLIMASLISYVAKPDPAVMPRHGVTMHDTVDPMRITRDIL